MPLRRRSRRSARTPTPRSRRSARTVTRASPRSARTARLPSRGENAEADKRAASAAETAKRAVTLACRAEVLDGVYKAVRARLAGLSGDERVAFLSGVLHAALAECHAREAHAKATFGENIAPKAYVLRLAAADLPLGVALIQDCGEPVTLGGEADIDGGLLLECGDTFINCSLDMILRDAREQTEPHIRTVLFG